MKKLIGLICFAVALLVAVSVFAGSIDVDLLSDDKALVFVGVVDDFTITDEEEDYPSTEYLVTITPNKKIKGDVVVDKSMKFEEVRTGKLKLQKNTKYLFGYMSDDLYIWELESYNDLFDWELDDYTKESIILKERHNDSISGGMQALLNDGAFAIAENERSTIGNQISFVEYLYKKPSLSSSAIEKVTLRYQDELYEVDKDNFLKIAEKILITNVKNEELHDMVAKPKQPDPYKTNLYVELLGANDEIVYYGAVSRFGEVDRYNLAMGRLMVKDYEMKKEDLSKLYLLLPDDVQKDIKIPEGFPDNKPLELPAVPKKTYTGWVISGAVLVFVIAFLVGFGVRRRK